MLSLFTDNIRNKKPFIFTKFGDGEIICMCKRYYVDAPMTNCDNQSYSDELSQKLINAAIYFSGMPDVYIGEWNFDTHYTPIFNDFLSNNYIVFNYVPYDIILHTSGKNIEDLKLFYTEISKSNSKKVYICCEKNNSAKTFLNCDIINVKSSEAYDDYEKIKKALIENKYDIYLYSCGLMSKPLIKDISEAHINTTHIDIGSGLDNLFNGITRANQIEKEELIKFYL